MMMLRIWAPGQTVITMMQGLGSVRAVRPGGYAEFVTVDAEAVAVIPADIDPEQMAALGLVGVTAYQGLRRIGPLGASESLSLAQQAASVRRPLRSLAHKAPRSSAWSPEQSKRIMSVRSGLMM
jgi:NADPH-dependent curcumin reductase CurA